MAAATRGAVRVPGGAHENSTSCLGTPPAQLVQHRPGLPARWSGLPFPPPGDLPCPAIELASPTSPVSLAWQTILYPLSLWGGPKASNRRSF